MLTLGVSIAIKRLEILQLFVNNIKKDKHIKTEGIFRIPADTKTVDLYYNKFKESNYSSDYLKTILLIADTHDMVSLFKKLLFDNTIKESYFYPHITYEEIETTLIDLSKYIVWKSYANKMDVAAITAVIAMQLQNINPKFKGMTEMEEAKQTKVFMEEIKRKIKS